MNTYATPVLQLVGSAKGIVLGFTLGGPDNFTDNGLSGAVYVSRQTEK